MKIKYSSRYIAVPLKVTTTLLILLFLLCFSQFIIGEIAPLFVYEDLCLKRPEWKGDDWEIARSIQKFMADGTIHLWRQPESKQINQDSKIIEIYDVNNNLIWKGHQKDQPYKYLSWPSVSRQAVDNWQLEELQQITPVLSRNLEIPVSSEEQTEEVWRYDFRRDIFTGYVIKGEKIGYIGANGFVEDRVKAESFGLFRRLIYWTPEGSFTPLLLWQTNHRIYQIDFENRQVELIFEHKDSEIEYLSLKNWDDTPSNEAKQKKYRSLIYCRTEDGKHHLITKEPQKILTLTLPDGLDNESANFTVNKQGIFMMYNDQDLKAPPDILKNSYLLRKWTSENACKPHKKWVELYKVSESAERRPVEGDFNLLNRFEWKRPAMPESVLVDKHEQLRHKAKMFTTKFSPAIYDLTWYFFGQDLEEFIEQHRIGIMREYAGIIGYWRPGYSFINLLLSLAMAVIVSWHGWCRRTSWSKLVFWVIIVAAFNLAGLLTYFGLNHSPRIKCPVCGKKRGIERDECVRCGRKLPYPQRESTDLILSA